MAGRKSSKPTGRGAAVSSLCLKRARKLWNEGIAYRTQVFDKAAVELCLDDLDIRRVVFDGTLVESKSRGWKKKTVHCGLRCRELDGDGIIEIEIEMDRDYLKLVTVRKKGRSQHARTTR